MNSPSCSSSSIRLSSSTGLPDYRAREVKENSLPITASVWSRSFSSAGSLSIRAARIACTVDGIFSSPNGLRELYRSLAN